MNTIWSVWTVDTQYAGPFEVIISKLPPHDPQSNENATQIGGRWSQTENVEEEEDSWCPVRGVNEIVIQEQRPLKRFAHQEADKC